MPENSESSHSDLSVEEQHKALLYSELYVTPVQAVKVEELERRLSLEQERLDRQEVREQRTEGLVLWALGGLTGAASITGLIASAAAVPALAPTILVGVAYLWFRSRLQHSERADRAAPPVFSSLGRDLARDREVIRCFSPRAIAPQQESH